MWDVWVERKLNCKFVRSTATRSSQTSEPMARKCFEETTGQTVVTTGLVVHETENWLSASLDRITDTDIILEIRFPTLKTLGAHDGSLLKTD